MINKYGECPNCGEDWDGGDIRDNLSATDSLKHKSEAEIDTIAASYGWTKFNKTRFTRVTVIEIEDGRILYQCPEVRCGHIFERDSDKEYSCMSDVYNNIITSGNTNMGNGNTIKDIQW